MLGRMGHGGVLGDRRGLAALEFALIAPVVALMTLAVFDIGRALIVWEELNKAADAIAQAAAKNSYTNVNGNLVTQLTASQMQDAMTTIYADIPGLNLGNDGGTFGGGYVVTLSSVQFWPLCQNTTGCGAQIPYTVWSSYLTQGGPHLNNGVTNQTFLTHQYERQCGPLMMTDQWPDNLAQLLYMVNPVGTSNGGQPMTIAPQVVADVQYSYTPTLSVFVGAVTLFASATYPAPYGGTAQVVAFDPSQGAGNVVHCPNPN